LKEGRNVGEKDRLVWIDIVLQDTWYTGLPDIYIYMYLVYLSPGCVWIYIHLRTWQNYIYTGDVAVTMIWKRVDREPQWPQGLGATGESTAPLLSVTRKRAGWQVTGG
jgi:hypothetical protein